MIYILLLSALIMRLILTPLSAFSFDMGCWVSWANHIFNVGPAKFYATIWSDYLPSYLYVLWFLAILHKILSFIPFEILLKFPSALADLGIGWLIYKTVKKSGKSVRYASLVSGLYLFNPFSIFNGSVWGQVDAVYVFALFLSVYLILAENKWYSWTDNLAWTALGIATLMKPQAIFFLPIFAIHEIVEKRWAKVVRGLIFYGVTIFLLSLPFFPKDPVSGLFNLVLKSSGTYPYTSVNAMNLWGVFGTWKPDGDLVFGVAKQYWGGVLLLAGLLIAWRMAIKGTSRALTYYSCALVTLAFFILPTRVHERWLFAFFPFFLITCALLNRKMLWVSYLLLSLIHFLNLYFVYTYYNPNYLKLAWLATFIEHYFRQLSLLSVGVFGYLMYYLRKTKSLAG